MPIRPALLGIPYDAASTFKRGAAAAPSLIREALRCPSSNTWSETGVDVARSDTGLVDVGDLRIDGHALPMDDIAGGIDALVREALFPIVLGGDHSITYPVVSGLLRSRAHFDILHIDAHPDLYDTFDGSRDSHASPFARIMETGRVARLTQVGVRAMNAHQRDQATRFGVHVIDMCRWTAGERPQLSGPTYLSIDLDGIDPAHAPGVSHPEPGGLTTRDVIGLVQLTAGFLIGADLVECNPAEDTRGTTTRVAAKLVKEIAGIVMTNPGPWCGPAGGLAR